MHRIAIVVGLVAVLVGPSAVLAGLVLVLGRTVNTWCAPADPAVVQVPDGLVAYAVDGTPVLLNRVQLTHAATIITIGTRTEGVGGDGILVALMAALTESGLRMLANTTAYPESATLPHDGDGSDHDSLGLFQMRPAAGWGSVGELMDPHYQAAAFYGGPTGPSHGSPRGLLDIPGWEQLPKGAAAQAVEVSAYPDRYAAFEPVAVAILDALTQASAATEPASFADTSAALPPAARVVFPLPAGTWQRTSGFGMRVNPVTGVYELHAGVDYAAASGTPILAVADGSVVFTGRTAGGANSIQIAHTISGAPAVTAYRHLRDGGTHVAVGDQVIAGQHIGDVGSTGNSTGPHLHFQVHPDGDNGSPVDPEPWLTGAADLTQPALAQAAAPACPTAEVP
ncbi:M23 family metallopeptidase [Georgenia yuyongxinii]|uniref:M23 family metallopeptidase n=1 Tax=Georgenia yuyongxinii TaxID=2589797 RepID=A0A552WX59_9MICO|nr:M23 family metallopeptidase [Georgenia yuyongxinii]TRW47421.1 M23 family metallopeptidase [Georgenia yuyongxinii]